MGSVLPDGGGEAAGDTVLKVQRLENPPQRISVNREGDGPNHYLVAFSP